MWKKINYKTDYIQVDILREINILCSSLIFLSRGGNRNLAKICKKA